MFDINPQIQKWILSVISVFAEQTANTEITLRTNRIYSFSIGYFGDFRAKLNTQLVY